MILAKRHNIETDGIESPEVNPHICDPMILTRVPRPMGTFSLIFFRAVLGLQQN